MTKFVSGMERSGFPEAHNIGFGKSCLIPETTNSSIGDGIVKYLTGFIPILV